MFLRKAELSDYETLKKFYEDTDSYHWIYEDTTKVYDENSEASLKAKKEFELELKFCKEQERLTFELFEEKLSEDYIYIYMIEDDDKKIKGYILLYDSCGGKYRISDWAILDPEDEKLKLETLEEIKKLKLYRLKEFTICTGSISTDKWLMENGFESTGGMTLRLQVRNQKTR